MSLARAAGILALVFGAAACSSSAPGSPADAGAYEGPAADASGSGGSGASGSSSGGGMASSSGGSSGSASGGSSGNGTGGSSSGGENCQAGQGDFCMCFSASSMEPANSTPCSPADLEDPGGCCAPAGWPSSGSCICQSFLCYVNQGGGRDCFYQDRGGNGLEVPTTSATGAACCVWGDASVGQICSCYDQESAGSCQGRQSVVSCTLGVLPTCSSIVTNGENVVPTCR